MMFSYAWALVWRRPIRSFLVIVGIIVAVFLVSVTVLTIQNGKRVLLDEFLKEEADMNRVTISNSIAPATSIQQIREALSSIGISKPTEDQEFTTLNPSLVEEVKNRSDVEHVYPVESLSTRLTYTLDETELEFDRTPEGRELDETSTSFSKLWGTPYELSRGEVMLNKTLLEENELGDPEAIIGQTVNVRYSPSQASRNQQRLNERDRFYPGEVDRRFKVAGVYSGNIESTPMFFTLTDAEELQARLGGYGSVEKYREENPYEILYVRAESGQVEALQEELQQTYSFKAAVTAGELLNFIRQISRVLEFVLLSFGVVASVVAVLSVMSVTMMNIHEQASSIGILKATGASPLQIGVMYIIYGVFIAVMGVLITLLLLWGLTAAVDPVIVSRLQEEGIEVEYFIRLSPQVIVSVFGGALLATVVGSIYPAVYAGLIDPKQTLTYD